MIPCLPCSNGAGGTDLLPGRGQARPLGEIFGGEGVEGVRRQLDTLHREVRSGRLFMALHMHTGDGNVHTNIHLPREVYPCTPQSKAYLKMGR
ncbi:hypothetical protein CCP3SC15_3030003 [Gammaproteobacteria bacterium]